MRRDAAGDSSVRDPLRRALVRAGQPDPAQQLVEVLAAKLADKAQHEHCGRASEPDGGPDDPDCGCRGTPLQPRCAREGCGFCRAAEDYYGLGQTGRDMLQRAGLNAYLSTAETIEALRRIARAIGKPLTADCEVPKTWAELRP